MAQDEEGYIIRRIPKEYASTMQKRGVGPHEMLFRDERYDVADNIVKITIDGIGMTQRTIGIQKQMRTLRSVSKNPLGRSYTLGISSYPTDRDAKVLASWLMYLGCKQFIVRHRAGRVLPLWHHVYGSYKDPLRDDPRMETPSMLLLSNINEESTGIKMEKVRDLLEMYQNVPRIIVCGGMDSASLFANRLHFPLDGAIHIGPHNRVRE